MFDIIDHGVVSWSVWGSFVGDYTILWIALLGGIKIAITYLKKY